MKRVRVHIPGGSSAHPYSNIVRSFPEITLGNWRGLSRRAPALKRASNEAGSCWIPGSWDLPMSYNPIVVTLSSLKPCFFNGLKTELGFSDHAWSIRPRNPIRAFWPYKDRLLVETVLSMLTVVCHCKKIMHR